MLTPPRLLLTIPILQRHAHIPTRVLSRTHAVPGVRHGPDGLADARDRPDLRIYTRSACPQCTFLDPGGVPLFYAIALIHLARQMSGGIMMNVTAVAYANFFGRKHLGAIQGFAQSAGVLGSALGPFPFGFTHDQVSVPEPLLLLPL